jgi:hypothetical protein
MIRLAQVPALTALPLYRFSYRHPCPASVGIRADSDMSCVQDRVIARSEGAAAALADSQRIASNRSDTSVESVTDSDGMSRSYTSRLYMRRMMLDLSAPCLVPYRRRRTHV